MVATRPGGGQGFGRMDRVLWPGPASDPDPVRFLSGETGPLTFRPFACIPPQGSSQRLCQKEKAYGFPDRLPVA